MLSVFVREVVEERFLKSLILKRTEGGDDPTSGPHRNPASEINSADFHSVQEHCLVDARQWIICYWSDVVAAQ